MSVSDSDLDAELAADPDRICAGCDDRPIRWFYYGCGHTIALCNHCHAMASTPRGALIPPCLECTEEKGYAANQVTHPTPMRGFCKAVRLR